jgi:hypothetical protein
MRNALAAAAMLAAAMTPADARPCEPDPWIKLGRIEGALGHSKVGKATRAQVKDLQRKTTALIDQNKLREADAAAERALRILKLKPLPGTPKAAC